MDKELINQIAITWEMCGGKELSEGAMQRVVQKLSFYKPMELRKALYRCEDECKGRITIGDIIQRIDDGHLGPDEAWALMPKSESDSVCWTSQMRDAFFVADNVDGDRVAKRMAFKEIYQRHVSDARAAHREPQWEFSPGSDVNGREPVITKAVELGRLDPAWVQREYPQLTEEIRKALPGQDDINKLIGHISGKMGK